MKINDSHMIVYKDKYWVVILMSQEKVYSSPLFRQGRWNCSISGCSIVYCIISLHKPNLGRRFTWPIWVRWRSHDWPEYQRHHCQWCHHLLHRSVDGCIRHQVQLFDRHHQRPEQALSISKKATRRQHSQQQEHNTVLYLTNGIHAQNDWLINLIRVNN